MDSGSAARIPYLQHAPQGCVLLVDDDRIIRMMLSEQLSVSNYTVIESMNGKQALAELEAHVASIDTIILDREMPEMSGMEFIRIVKQDARYRHIPIIMITGHDKPEQIKEGIEAGVYYYLTKPLQMAVLKPVLDAANREASRTRTLRKELRMHRNSFLHMQQAQYTMQTLQDADGLACFLAYCFPEPERAVHGLSALFTNAIEHGIAEIGFAYKNELSSNSAWREAVEERLHAAASQHKTAHVIFRRREEGCYVTITDPGPGFNWREYITYSPSRAQHKHGRGIAQALAISFDSLTYNEKGNEAIGFVAQRNTTVW